MNEGWATAAAAVMASAAVLGLIASGAAWWLAMPVLATGVAGAAWCARQEAKREARWPSLELTRAEHDLLDRGCVEELCGWRQTSEAREERH